MESLSPGLKVHWVPWSLPRATGESVCSNLLFSCAIVPGENKHLTQLKKELCAYFDGDLRQFSVPLDYPGSPFQLRVWNELRRIPFGETCSYEELALRIGSESGQRAVGHANGANRIAILIPCHRVVNKNGKLGGYGGGLWRKQHLLELERGGPAPGERRPISLKRLERNENQVRG